MAGQIAVFTPYIHAFGGVERLFISLSRFLHGRGLNHTVVCFDETIDLSSSASWPMSVTALHPARNPIAEGRALYRYFHRAKGPLPLFYDLKSAFYAGLCGGLDFHLHISDPPSLLPADVSKYALSLRGTSPGRTSAEPAGPLTQLRGEVVHRINRRGARRARSLITMSDANAVELEALYGRETKVIRQGVSSPPLVGRLRERQLKPFRMLSVSRLEPNKRLDWILEAVAKLEFSSAPLSAQCDWLVDVAGDGSQTEALKALARKLNIQTRVIFHGRVEDAALDALYANAGLFLMPAIQGYGLPALEALTREVPIIMHRESGVSEILGNSPWVAVIGGGRDDLASAIWTMIAQITSGEVAQNPMPRFPTDLEWAEEIARTCGWV